MSKKTIRQRGLRRLCLASLLLPALAGAQTRLSSENDFLGEIPVVLSVTRLAQPLDETPAAVTIIDKETIRRSGAREMAELLRLVPGYLVGGWNAANLSAVYHAPFDDERGQRNLLLIDGRRVYSSFALGDTHHGMMGVLIEDIERIEVLRGSNSAAYGANAMFGVINVVTRHSADTTGTTLSATAGQNGIADYYASWGWYDGRNGLRLSAGKRADEGWRNINDDKSLKQAHLRADLEPAADQQLMVSVDAVEHLAGEGFPNDDTNGLRNVGWKNWAISGDWHWQYAPDREIRVLANYDAERITDRFPLAPLPAIVLDQGGKSERWNLEVTQQFVLSPSLQAVWGMGYLNERAESVPVFGPGSPVSYSEWRVFGNINWSLFNDRLNLNAGGFSGQHSESGNYFTPRLMANLKVADGQTLRAGVTEAVRSPTLFELKANMLYYLDGKLFGRYYSVRSQVDPERLRSREIGYFGNFPEARVTVDVRAFRESIIDRIATSGWSKEATDNLPLDESKEYINEHYQMHWRGYESQTRWRPVEGTQIWFNQTHIVTTSDDPKYLGKNSAPRNSMSLILFQELPYAMDASVMFHRVGAMNWRRHVDRLPAYDRVDLRLAKKFKIGATAAEAALTVQAVQGDYKEFLGRQDFMFERRAFGTLRLQF